MPPKSKSKSRKKKKPAVQNIDPDINFRQLLDSMHYIPKSSRDKLTRTYLNKIDLAIKAFTLAEPPLEPAILIKRERELITKIKTQIPMQIVPQVMRALGMNPTAQQMRQIAWLVLADSKQVGNNNNNININNINNGGGGGGGDGEGNGQQPQQLKAEEIQIHNINNNKGEEHQQTYQNQKEELMADRSKLEALALEILQTGLLVYDPQKINDSKAATLAAAEESTSKFMSSVIEFINPDKVDSVFDILWAASKRQVAKDGLRFIESEDLRKVLETSAAAMKNTEPAMTPEEFEEFLFFVCDSAHETMSEDAYALATLYGI